MPDIDLSDFPEVEGAKKQWRSFIERNQSIVVQVRETSMVCLRWREPRDSGGPSLRAGLRNADPHSFHPDPDPGL